ncbi:tRNA pseudouridine(55) synthase TruB [Flavobacteriaceae bacterium]|nr:tRNA pseudouridine(55) synthase TruB [Flavobacteriaceae bacterium]
MDFFKQNFNSEELQEGQIFLIDKPLGWTSFQVVNKIRWHLKNTTGLKKLKVGHAGTLDPLATGLLLICTGKKTKIISTLQDSEKEYTGTFKLGATTPSYDLETEIDETFSIEHVTSEILEKTTKQFIGKIQQQPPVFSALKKDGKRLYEYARAGQSVEIQKRDVTVVEFKITNTELPNINFLIRCSKGTYIRSLAHDFGKSISSGAHLTALTRTQSGGFNLKDAYTMDSVLNYNPDINIKSK